AAEALVDRVGARKAVDQHHGARAFAAPIEADRWALPIDPQTAGILGVKRALAITQSCHKCAARFLTEDVTVGQAPVADRLFDDLGEAARHGAEEFVAGPAELAGLVAGLLLGLRRWRLLRNHQAGAEAGEGKDESNGP